MWSPVCSYVHLYTGFYVLQISLYNVLRASAFIHPGPLFCLMVFCMEGTVLFLLSVDSNVLVLQSPQRTLLVIIARGQRPSSLFNPLIKF